MNRWGRRRGSSGAGGGCRAWFWVSDSKKNAEATFVPDDFSTKEVASADSMARVDVHDARRVQQIWPRL